MNPIRSLIDRFRAWEDGYLRLIDDLNDGRVPAARWSDGPWRRRLVTNLSALSAAERNVVADFARRYRGRRGVLPILVMGLFATTLGLALHAAFPDRLGVAESVITTHIVVFGLAFGMLSAWLNPRSLRRLGSKQMLAILLLAVAGMLCGAGFVSVMRGESVLSGWARLASRDALMALLVIGGLYAGALAFVVGWRNRELNIANTQLASEAERERLANELARSQLRLLRAQIEPHFLYNTLGAVQQMADSGSPQTGALVGHLVRFLRSSSRSFGSERTTLAEEFAIAESYLNIMSSRLGPRLAFGVSLPAELRDRTLVSTALLTLVENAVKHGIEPATKGGSVNVRAFSTDAELVVEVEDTGAGMPDVPGSGTGLENLRRQLDLVYAGRARLELSDNLPSGVLARLCLPKE